MSAPPIPGAYVRMRREAARLSLDDVAAKIATEPPTPLHERRQWLETIEAGEAPISLSTAAALRRAFPFDLAILVALAGIADGNGAAPPRLCVVCGCSEDDACVDGDGVCCAWAGADWCTACPAPLVPAA